MRAFGGWVIRNIVHRKLKLTLGLTVVDLDPLQLLSIVSYIRAVGIDSMLVRDYLPKLQGDFVTDVTFCSSSTLHALRLRPVQR